MNNRRTLWFCPIHINIIGMDYNFHTLQSVWAEANEVQGKEKNQLECIAFSAELKIAFDIDTSGNDVTLRCSVSWVCREPSVLSQSECITIVQ